MSLISLIAVFLIEQLQPLDYRRVVEEPLEAWADFVESRFDAGEYLRMIRECGATRIGGCRNRSRSAAAGFIAPPLDGPPPGLNAS